MVALIKLYPFTPLSLTSILLRGRNSMKQSKLKVALLTRFKFFLIV